MRLILIVFFLFLSSILYANNPPLVKKPVQYVQGYNGIYKISIYGAWTNNSVVQSLSFGPKSEWITIGSSFMSWDKSVTQYGDGKTFAYYHRANFDYFKPSCVAPKILNTLDGSCGNDCPDGKIKDASGLYCVSATCPIGSTRDPITLHCLPIKCPTGQTLLSDGQCHGTCPPNSSRVADLTCRYDCSHWSESLCGKYLDSKGNKCVFSMPSFDSFLKYKPYCMTEQQSENALSSYPLGGLGAKKLPKLPDFPVYEPMPIKPYQPEPVTPVKPANDPDYIPVVEPVPVTPISPEPVPVRPSPAEVPANDPNYVPAVDPITPLTPDIVPYSPPAPPAVTPTPEPVPLPAPAYDPVTAPEPSPLPLPAPSVRPISAPEPPPSSNANVDTPFVKPDLVPAPVPAPVPDSNETMYGGTPAPTEPLPDYTMPNVPTFDLFSTDGLDKFRYDAELMSRNFLDQIQNVQTTVSNTYNILDQGLVMPDIDSGQCGDSMTFDFYGNTIDLCTPLSQSISMFAPIISLFVFLLGLLLSIRLYYYGLKD